MNIYIPQHLRKIKIVELFINMANEYAKIQKTEESSFDNYKYSLKIDPVKRFIGTCLGNIENSEEYESTVNYLSRLFYSVKGTIKVFEYMRMYLTNLNIKGDITYTVGQLDISLGDLNIKDEEEFYQELNDFLNNLLYYGSVRTESGTIKLKVSTKIENSLSGGISTHKIFTVTRLDKSI